MQIVAVQLLVGCIVEVLNFYFGNDASRETFKTLLKDGDLPYIYFMTHGQLVRLAERWLRRQRYRIILTEQTASSGEVPDVIGWRDSCRSIVIECKISRPDFLADSSKVARRRPESAMGCERFYLTPAGMLNGTELPNGWGLLEAHKNDVEVAVRPDSRSLRTKAGLIAEMELLWRA